MCQWSRVRFIFSSFLFLISQIKSDLKQIFQFQSISLHESAVVAVLGKSQNIVNMNVPFKQISHVNCIRNLKTGPEHLLFVPNTVEFDRYTLPTYVPPR